MTLNVESKQIKTEKAQDMKMNQDKAPRNPFTRAVQWIEVAL